MIVSPLPPLDLSCLLAGDPARSPGLHLSTIIKDINQTLDPVRFSGPLDALRIGTGVLVEEFLGRALTVRIRGWEKPGEFVDSETGIIMSPDGIDPEAWAIDEIKATWMSSKEGVLHPKLSHYLMQVKAYARAIGTRVTHLHTFFVNGDYKPPAPCLRSYRLEFTERELQENWTMLVRHAKQRGMLR